MRDPLAYHITWSTYGAWLPGDARGWVADGESAEGDAERWLKAREQMKGAPVALTLPQRRIVQETVEKHCAVRGWCLHAVNARTKHVHAVITIPVSVAGATARDQFKAWCTRNLNNACGRKDWWAVGGTAKPIYDDSYLQNAIQYVLEGQ